MLSFAAELRMCNSTKAERRERVLTVLRRLHLADDEIRTRIGSVDERGLSGGQRKRVSIGLELIGSPRVLLVDEPTSGLDAKMALSVIQLLRELCRDGGGQTVVASIHQPSWKVFTQFHSALLISKGAVAYAGRVDAAISHFSRLGFDAAPNENPADYFMFLLQDDCEARGVDLLAAWSQREEGGAHGGALGGAAGCLPTRNGHGAAAGGATSGAAYPMADGSDGLSNGAVRYANGEEHSSVVVGSPKQLRSPRYAVGFSRQTQVLFRRRLHDVAKDPSKFFRTLGLRFGVGLLVGVVWFGDGRSDSFAEIFPTIGSLFLIVNNSTLDILLDTVQFPLTRALLRKEYNNGYYSVGAYYLALLCSNLILCFTNAMVLAMPVYALVGLSFSWVRFGTFVSCLALLSLVGSAIGVLVGCLSKDLSAARGMILPTIVPLLIFSGYLIPRDRIPWYFTWMYYASFFQYSFGLLQVNELTNRTFTEDCPAQVVEERVEELIRKRFPHFPLPPIMNTTCTGEEYLQTQGLWPLLYGGVSGYFAILGAYMVIAHFCAYLLLLWKCHRMTREHA